MPAKPLTPAQLEDAARLYAEFRAAQARNPSITQESVAHDAGWKTQGAVSQYFLGKIPLNIEALLKFSNALNLAPDAISPTLAKLLPAHARSQPFHSYPAHRAAPPHIASEPNAGEHDWPFRRITRAAWGALNEYERGAIEERMFALMMELRPERKSA